MSKKVFISGFSKYLVDLIAKSLLCHEQQVWNMQMGSSCLPPGFRFHPTDEELIGYYLSRKVEGLEIELEVIPVIDLYKFDPWELPGNLKTKSWLNKIS